MCSSFVHRASAATSMLAPPRSTQKSFYFFIFSGIEDHHAVELTERSPNPPSNSKKVKLVTGNSIFRSHRNVAEARRARRDPPCGGRYSSVRCMRWGGECALAADLARMWGDGMRCAAMVWGAGRA